MNLDAAEFAIRAPSVAGREDASEVYGLKLPRPLFVLSSPNAVRADL